MKRVFEIAQKLEINKFVDLLPQGYNTSLKENGEGLSGGQKQLIAVARTLYKESEIIVFDEASSALDAVNEKRLLQIIQELKSDDKTIILITHRISSARYADQIIVLHDGKAIEQGTHESLIEMPDTKYSQLWQNQYKIF
jgi:ATP-binding cassette subfamily B protein